MKNVRKDCPLLAAEIYELKGIRKTLSKVQWEEWLGAARDEKHRRRDEANLVSLSESSQFNGSESKKRISFSDEDPIPIPGSGATGPVPTNRRAAAAGMPSMPSAVHSPTPDWRNDHRYNNPSDEYDADDSLESVYQAASSRHNTSSPYGGAGHGHGGGYSCGPSPVSIIKNSQHQPSRQSSSNPSAALFSSSMNTTDPSHTSHTSHASMGSPKRSRDGILVI